MAKVKLYYTPVEVVVAALSTESSTMEELDAMLEELFWQETIFVSTFIHCTMRNTFDVCMMGS